MVDASDVLLQFRAQFPEFSGVEDGLLLGKIHKMIELAPLLNLTTSGEFVGVLGLRSSLTPEQLASPLCKGALKNVMAATDWPFEKRIAFLRRHFVGRKVEAEDGTLGRSLFGG